MRLVSPATRSRGFQFNDTVDTVATLCRKERIPSMKKTPMKAAGERKTLMIKIRVNVGQLKMLQAAADQASLDLSTWIRTVALRAAKKE